MANNSRPPYRGTELGLVISIDFGTTFSGTSWALLDPNQIPQIWDVTGFEGLEHQASSTKVPTVLLYDRYGRLQAAGSQTSDSDILIEAQEQNWIRCEWFKLLLRPEHLREALDKAPTTNLPPGKKLVDVIGDFYRYIVGLAHKHFNEKMVGSKLIWEKAKDKIQYVLSHPNGWNTFQHTTLFQAAIKGGLIPDSDEGRSRIRFVSEGEASLHWCLNEGLGRKNLHVGSNFVVVDAGGGTIDTSSFRVTSLHPLQLKELNSPDCSLVGSVFVTQAFQEYVNDKLVIGGSRYADPESIERMVEDFDQKVKCTFRRSDRKQAVTFGGSRTSDPRFGIQAGRLIVEGHEMAEFFEPACNAAETAIRRHATPGERTTVVVVGGFAANPYLFSELQSRLVGINIDLLRADNATAKAAANGAIGFYLDHYVSARVARWTYGVSCCPPLDPTNYEHTLRDSQVFTDPVNGQQYVSGGFRGHLKKGVVVEETTLIRFPFQRSVSTRGPVDISGALECYRGDRLDIEFQDQDELNMFQSLCSVKAVIPETCLVEKFKSGTFKNTRYWDCNFSVAVSFGTTEFKCVIEWTDERGVLQRGTATPVWNEG